MRGWICVPTSEAALALPARPGKRDLRFAKAVVFVNALVPGFVLAWDAAHHLIGANGVNFALHTTGLLAFIFLLLSLLVTPLRLVTGWAVLISFRRTLGLYAFFYACVHFLIFYALDRGGSLTSTVHEVLVRKYLVVGTSGLLLMVPLAVTSTNAMVMRLGAKRWKRLHRLSYLVGVAAAVHYYWLVKSDVRQPLVFAGVLTALLGFRLVHGARERDKLRDAKAAALARPATPTTKPRFWSGELRVAEIIVETPDVRTFRLVADDGGALPFAHQAGQYLNMMLTIDGKRVNRSFTIASSPTRAQHCEVTVKRSPTGPASKYLHEQVREGSKLRISAPAGRFVFSGADTKKVVLLAGGVGVTPLMAMIRFLTDRAWAGDIYLVFSVRTQADLIFREELATLERRFPNLHVCLTLTKEAGDAWKGRRGAITKDLLTSFVPELTSGPIYLCGPDGMMAAMRALLLELSVAPSAINTEAFVSAVAEAATLAPELGAASEGAPPLEDASTGVGRIRFARSAREAEPSAGKTILESAEDAGVSIPFECRSGICGQCKTRLVSGRVTMETEDALSGAEKAKGLILACQAHAVGDVTLDA
ncbi:MAG: Oxidoreductase FAD-binding domain protein [Myxococcales bacterium]|nr:Oxidoreductase FAD-binding domain protein [Myxococcales bacterium]